MGISVTIQDFSALLKSEKEDGFMEMLRRIAQTASPEDIQTLQSKPVGPTATWVGWK
jgi:hypothetical protein